MEELLKKLEELYNSNEEVEVGEEGYLSYFQYGDITEEATGLCNELLITEHGQCNWKNIDILRANGYSVYKGDGDSFGWLVGCVRKNGDNRVLIYG